MMYRRLSLFLLLFASVAAFCQSVTGTLLGTVADASGVVPGVKVTATNQGKNVTLSTVTNQVGDYEFDNLSAGLYRIHVERQSFRSVDVKNVQLLLNQTTRNNVSLVPGEVHQSIEVTAAAPVIQSETSSIATIIDTNSIQKLPVNGRTMDTFIATVPGNTGEASGSNPKIAGSEHWGGTSFTVDGVGYNDLGNGGGAYSYQTSLTTQPSLDTIQEVKVESNNAKAEFSSTVAISMITKGGTNRFHGSIFAYNRNTVFAANAIGGAKRFLDLFVNPDPSRRVLLAGTYNGHPVPTAAAIATIERLRENNGAIYSQLEQMGASLQTEIESIAKRHGLPLLVVRQGSAFCLYLMDHAPQDWHDLAAHHDFTTDKQLRRRLIDEGIYTFPVPAKQWSISAAHTQQDLEQTVQVLQKVLPTIKN